MHHDAPDCMLCVWSVRVAEVIDAVDADVSIVNVGRYDAAVTTLITPCVVDVGSKGEAIAEVHEYAVVKLSCPPLVPLFTVVPAINGDAQRALSPAGLLTLNDG